MTYGVYTKDLHKQKIGGVSLKEAKEWLKGDFVLCSEKRKYVGCEIRIVLHRWKGFRFERFENAITIGFVRISFETLWFLWADKIIESE